MKKINNKATKLIGTTIAAAIFSSGVFSEGINVLHISAFSGPTSDVGQPYGQGVSDVLKYTNANGGINGQMLDFESVDYGYKAPQAIALYKKALSKGDLVALQGWGTADTEALVGFVANDKVFTMSASFSAHLSDPKGKSERTQKPAPYNFFYGPTYSDACRGLIDFAAEDWKKSGKSGKPKFVHMGANHPYPNAPKEACASYAEDMGFEVGNPIVYSLSPGDFKAQCLSLKDSGADYAYMGNTAGSNISLIKSCHTVGVDTRFMGNVWAWDLNTAKAVGEGGDGVVFFNSTGIWGDDVPGMDKLKAISATSDPEADYRSVHYIKGVCAASNMVDAMKLAASKGKVTGTSLKDAMESLTDHVPEGLDGMCLPSTWTADDHRGMTKVGVLESTWNNGDPSLSEVYVADIPRKPEWLGW